MMHGGNLKLKQWQQFLRNLVVESQKTTFIVTAVVSRNVSQTVTRYNTKAPSVFGGGYFKSRLCVPWRSGYVLSSLTFVIV
jgi:hypothetical protein